MSLSRVRLCFSLLGPSSMRRTCRGWLQILQVGGLQAPTHAIRPRVGGILQQLTTPNVTVRISYFARLGRRTGTRHVEINIAARFPSLYRQGLAVLSRRRCHTSQPLPCSLFPQPPTSVACRWQTSLAMSRGLSACRWIMARYKRGQGNNHGTSDLLDAPASSCHKRELPSRLRGIGLQPSPNFANSDVNCW